jgi:hypothetical protein
MHQELLSYGRNKAFGQGPHDPATEVRLCCHLPIANQQPEQPRSSALLLGLTYIGGGAAPDCLVRSRPVLANRSLGRTCIMHVPFAKGSSAAFAFGWDLSFVTEDDWQWAL